MQPKRHLTVFKIDIIWQQADNIVTFRSYAFFSLSLLKSASNLS